MPKPSTSIGKNRSARSSVIASCLLIALLLLMLAGCSNRVSPRSTPPLPANLAQPCPPLPPPPDPLVDPARMIWEMVVVAAYGDCGARHRAAVEAGRGE